MVAVLAVWLLAAASTSAQSAAVLAFVQQPSNAPSGGTISPAVTVAIENSFGVVVTPDTSSVTLSIGAGSNGSGTLGGTLTVAAVNGVATFSDLSISAAGTYTLQATDVDGAVTLTPAVSTAFTMSVQVKVAFVQQPAGAQAGGVIAPPVIVDVEDASGNVVTSDHSNVTVAIGPGSSGLGTLGGTLTVAAVNGVATFNNLTLSAAGSYTLEASDGALAPANAVFKGTTYIGGSAAEYVFVFEPAAGSGSSGGGGSGGGCAMAPAGEPDILVLLLPLAALGFGIGTRLIRRGRPEKV